MKRAFTIVSLLSALWLVIGCGESHERMLHQLEMQEQANRADSVMRNDSLAEALAGYFDSHGSANERMRACYILGRTYFDLGELPRALETYYQAADCADTTAADCDYKTLSRVHAQAAEVFRRQIQLQSALAELRAAEYWAKKGKDALMAIECYASLSDIYNLMNKPDSVIYIKARSVDMFKKIGREDRAAQTVITAVTSLLKTGNTAKAAQYISLYEKKSGFFKQDGEIRDGCEIYYYIKGRYYLAVGRHDSAEYFFRKELSRGKDLNNQIAACRGLQEIFAVRSIPDSLAKYANLGYMLNDSAYSMSEMENIQKFQQSYNYSHNKQLADEKEREAERTRMALVVLCVFIMLVTILSLYLLSNYRHRKDESIRLYQLNLEQLTKAQTELMELRSCEKQELEGLINRKNEEILRLQGLIASQKELHGNSALLEQHLEQSIVVRRLHGLLECNPPQQASQVDFRELRDLVNKHIPHFYTSLNTAEQALRPIEYDVCLLVRTHFLPAEICRLTGRSDSYISNLRKGILQKVYGVKGTPKDLDQRILRIH